MSVDHVNREERKRLIALAVQARQSRPTPKLCESPLISQRWTIKKKDTRRVSVQLKSLQLRNGIVAGDYVRQQIIRHHEFEAMQGQGVIHVKDGVPLTEYGKKLLEGRA